MSEYRINDSRSEGYRNRAQDFYNRWGLDRSRPEKWTESRDQFSEEDRDLFLREDFVPRGMGDDEGFYMGRQTRSLSGMEDDEYYTAAQRDEVKKAMSELGIDSADSDVQSGQVLSHMFKKHMEHGLPTNELLDAREDWDRSKSRVGKGSIHYDPTSGKTGPGVVGGVGAAADYGNRATDEYQRFTSDLDKQAKLDTLEMGHAGGYHLGRFLGKVPELASGDIKDLYEYYSEKITA